MRAVPTTDPTTAPAIAPPERRLPPALVEYGSVDLLAAAVFVEDAVAPAIAEDVTAVGSWIDTLKQGMSPVNCAKGTYVISAHT